MTGNQLGDKEVLGLGLGLGVGILALLTRQYEYGVKNVIQNTTGELFIDVGAKYGFYSLLAKDTFSRIIAFEPHPENMTALQHNIRGQDSIVAYPKAVSNYTGTGYLYLAPWYLPGYHSLHTLKESSHQKIEIATTTLADALTNEKEITLIKVDVEGVEWEVIEGAEPIMVKIHAWIIELHDATRAAELTQRMQALGYSVQWVGSEHLFAFR